MNIFIDSNIPPAPYPTPESHTWELIGGNGRNASWTDDASQDRVRALCVFRGELYAGIGTAQAEVWKFDGNEWEQVAGGGINRSWPAFTGAPGEGAGPNPGYVWVNSFLSDAAETCLYAGIKNNKGAELWRFDGSAWELAGGRGEIGDWQAPDYDHVYTLAWHEGVLHAGMHGHSSSFGAGKFADDQGASKSGSSARYMPEFGNGEIYRFDGGRWERISGQGINGSWDEDHSTNVVYKLLSLKDDLYAAIGRFAVNHMRWTGEVWRMSNGRWERLGGEGIRNSWNLNSTNLVTSLLDYQGKLIVGYNCQACPDQQETFGNVWAWDPESESWHMLSQPAECEDPSQIPNQKSFNISDTFNGHLVFGSGRANITGKLAIWLLDIENDRWVCLGHPNQANYLNPVHAEIWKRNEYAYSMAVFNDDLIVGFKGPDGTGDVWRCTSV